MVTRVTGRPRFGLLLLGIAVLALAAGALPRSAAPKSTVAGTLPCTTGTTFDLKATTGRISTPDGGSLFMWGFAKSPGAFQMPGPILCVTEGATVTVNLLNNLSEPVSIVFPGQTGVTATGTGPPGLFALEAAPGGTVSYSFVAAEPGTYLYESGTNPHKQVQMGLYGALIVRPSMGPNFAYSDAATQFDPAREYLLLLHDIAPDLHRAERGEPYDVTTKHDRYWTINGRSFPDTIAADNVSYLPSQPYGALVRVRPATPTSQPALIRMANAGMSNHPFHPHGNHVRVIAQDGRLLGAGAGLSYEQFTQTAGSGQTFDLLFKWANVENWSSTHPLPVTLPSLRQLVFKDDFTWYSGSPYLGKKAAFPSGVVSNNRCGEYYYPWHSHALNEFQNFDEGFGGLATLLRVDPPVGLGTPPSCLGP
jgi:FtsP/CotA-like multicopper oxidase with cupredoxin domain